jgi:RNA polymerase sigma factor (TIGR02999 family)
MATEVTRLIAAWRAGDDEALDRLVPLVYDELRALARHRLREERGDHTLQATALVHEAYARLVGAELELADRAHFFAVAARTMRRILVDHARARAREKRGGGARVVSLAEDVAADGERGEELLALDDAIARLAEMSERKAQVVELHYFGGLTYPETAAALGISEATVDRDLRMAKAWLANELKDAPGE